MRVDDGSVGSSSSAVTVILTTKRLLVLFPGYAAPTSSDEFVDGGPLGNVFAMLLVKLRVRAMREHVRFYRDYYANPRSPAYMAERLRELFDGSTEGRRVLVLDPTLDIDAASVAWASEVRRNEDRLARATHALSDLKSTHDAVLLVHSDALGLGLGPLERRLVVAFPSCVFVFNGRRRLYRLDRRMQRGLRRRRTLAETRIVEALLARLMPALGWLLAGFDRLTSRKLT